MFNKLKENSSKKDIASLQKSEDFQSEHDAETRSGISRLFILGFFIAFLIIFVFVYLYNSMVANKILEVYKLTTVSEPQLFIDMFQPVNVTSLLSLMANVLGAPLGFIIGYYYKDSKSSRQPT